MKLEFVIERFQAFRDSSNTSTSQLQFHKANTGYVWIIIIITWPCGTNRHCVWSQGNCNSLLAMPAGYYGDGTRATFACHTKSPKGTNNSHAYDKRSTKHFLASPSYSAEHLKTTASYACPPVSPLHIFLCRPTLAGGVCVPWHTLVCIRSENWQFTFWHTLNVVVKKVSFIF